MGRQSLTVQEVMAIILFPGTCPTKHQQTEEPNTDTDANPTVTVHVFVRQRLHSVELTLALRPAASAIQTHCQKEHHTDRSWRMTAMHMVSVESPGKAGCDQVVK